MYFLTLYKFVGYYICYIAIIGYCTLILPIVLYDRKLYVNFSISYANGLNYMPILIYYISNLVICLLYCYACLLFAII